MMMGKQVREKTRQNSPTTSMNGLLGQRPFASLEPEHESLGREARFGYSFGEIGLFPIQPKLVVGPPDDKYEREADRISEQVMQMSESGALQAKESPEQVPLAQGQDVSSIVHEVLRSPGQSLDPSTRAFIEPRFGHNFSHVRVHTDTKAATSADALAASAYTVGGHLVFGAGHYRPATEDGCQLIAHELSHVLQQGEGPIPARLDLGSAASPLEHQADMLSREVLAPSEFRETPVAALTTTESRSQEMGYAIQSKLGVAARQIQRRRVPGTAGLAAAVPTSGLGLASARTGLARILSRAWGGLTGTQQAAVRSAVSGLGITWTTEEALLTRLNSATRAQLLRFAREILKVKPSAELGDPLLINTGPRPGTADATNIGTLVSRADSIFATIAGGARDSDIAQVFGNSNIATAKTKYANARTRMNQLRIANGIVTDRSGYSTEVGLGGLSGSNQIALHPTVIDHPKNNESIITLIHESMHAGNRDIRDFGYISQPSFTALAESVKLTNAAHFEVVPRRILGANHAFAGVTFVPAGTTTGGITAPPLTPRQQAIRNASEMFRAAWTVGLNLHTLFVRVFRSPTEWNTLNLSTVFSGATAGARFANTLPFWSNVEMLTIHRRTANINPAGAPAVRPVTLIDIALSEGLIRKLSQGMNNVPPTPQRAQAFENANATLSERTTAAASVTAERNLLIKLVIKIHLGRITGSVSRDERVVERMARANRRDFSDILAVRPPSAF